MKRSKLILLILIPVCLSLVVVGVVAGRRWLSARAAADRAEAQAIEAEMYNRQCRDRLGQIGQGCLAYSRAHSGSFPETLAAIGVVPVCPGSGERYVYLGKGFNISTISPDVATKYVIAYEPSASHFGQRWFLFADGHLEIFYPKASDPMIAALNAGKNPPR
jgi:hypothetical protein